MLTAYVYPAFNGRYYTHFVDALRTVLGPGSLRYTLDGFPRFGPNCLAFRVGEGRGKKIYIHAQDPSELDELAIEWCDVFGKVNLDPAAATDKVVALGPTFPFRIGSPTVATLRGLLTYWRGRGHANRFRKHVGDHRGQSVTRFSESAYEPTEAEHGYVFFNSSVWEFEKEGNDARARFIEACRSIPEIRFEGGLFPRDSVGGEIGWKALEYGDYLSPRYSAAENLEKSRRSLLTMNNPSCLGCHSWRFGEQLALGKAIITTPLRRAMPAPLVHGEHAHYVDGTVESFREAILTIANDDVYRRRLERGARAYHEQYLKPTRAIARVIEAAGIPLADALWKGRAETAVNNLSATVR